MLGPNVYEFRAIFQARPSESGHRENHRPFPTHTDEHSFEIACGADGDDESVLIQSVEIMDRAKNPIPSLAAVWVKRPDELFYGRTGESYFSVYERLIKRVFIPCNRELYAVVTSAISSYQCAKQQIERTAKVVNSITNDGGEFLRYFFMHMENQGQRPIGAILSEVFLDHDSIGVPREKNLGLGLELVDVLLGPSYF